MKHFYHFTGPTLRNGEPIPPIGEWLEFTGKLEPCVSGLHASEHPFDALQYAPGALLHRVQLGKERVSHGSPPDKWVSSSRKIMATIDATDLLRRFARRVASDVLPLWNAPEVVKQYLETGDESIRSAAWSAARDAAWDAAWAAARAAAWAAAWDAAWAAARAAAWDAAMKKYRQWFLEMVEEEFSKATEKHENAC